MYSLVLHNFSLDNYLKCWEQANILTHWSFTVSRYRLSMCISPAHALLLLCTCERMFFLSVLLRFCLGRHVNIEYEPAAETQLSSSTVRDAKGLYSKNLIQIAVYQFTIGKFLKIDIVMVNLPKKLSALSHTSCNFTWTKHVHIVRVMLCTPFERNVCKLCANKACPS